MGVGCIWIVSKVVTNDTLDDNDLSLNHTSFYDPRLNEKQSVELAFLITGHLRQDRQDKQKKRA
jgi:3-deoxy-D-arabino-heptulosonate 7-phosphate (DAHP) synthase class II